MALRFAQREQLPPTETSPAHRAGDTIEQVAVPCAFMRGGSSRGGFFLDGDLPPIGPQRDAILLAAYGSPDSRQIDGIGGADPLTSKAAVVRRSERPDADVEYSFYQVGIEQPKVSIGGSCGNMLAAVGPFAIRRGLVKAVEPETTVRIYTTNTKQVVTARIPVRNGEPACEGTCTIAGVPDPGAAIRLDFGDCSGAVSGKLLPTGNARDRIEIDGKSIEVSFIDAATSFVYVKASDIGGTGTETQDELRSNEPLMARLEKVRGWAAVVLGLVSSPEQARTQTPNIPRVIMIAPPSPYRSVSGAEIAASDVDICVRQLAMQRPHKALAVTGAVCTAVANAVPGSIVAEVVGKPVADVRLGHPSGVLRVASRTRRDANGGIVIESAEIERTARLIMEGALFIRRRKIDQLTGMA